MNQGKKEQIKNWLTDLTYSENDARNPYQGEKIVSTDRGAACIFIKNITKKSVELEFHFRNIDTQEAINWSKEYLDKHGYIVVGDAEIKKFHKAWFSVCLEIPVSQVLYLHRVG